MHSSQNQNVKRKMKGPGVILHKVCFIRIEKRIKKKRSSVFTYLIVKASLKYNKYAVSQTLEHFDDASFRDILLFLLHKESEFDCICSNI